MVFRFQSFIITIPPRVWVCREIRLALNWLNWLTNPVSSVFLPKCEVDQPILTGRCLSFTIRFTPKQENSMIRLCLFCWWVECSKNAQKIKIYPNYIIHSGYCKMYPRSSLSHSLCSLSQSEIKRERCYVYNINCYLSCWHFCLEKNRLMTKSTICNFPGKEKIH